MFAVLRAAAAVLAVVPTQRTGGVLVPFYHNAKHILRAPPVRALVY